MRFLAGTDAVVSRVRVPGHLCGWSKLVHGGILSTILDEIMSWAAIYLLKSIPLTRSITVDFLKPAFVGSELEAVGRVGEIKGRREAVMEGFLNGPEGGVCARARGNFALVSAPMARKLNITDAATLAWFEKVLGTGG